MLGRESVSTNHIAHDFIKPKILLYYNIFDKTPSRLKVFQGPGFSGLVSGVRVQVLEVAITV